MSDSSDKNDRCLRPHDFCGEYEVLEFVVAGGMGEVYKVRGKLGGKLGALKRVKAQFLERDDLLERFQTEAQILARLDHKYIVGLLYAGWHDGSPYIVMEWLEGVTLRDFMNYRRAPLDLADSLHNAIRIAEALVAAHGVGILHRDLKPENVFMLKRGKLKVLDFGLGKLSESNRVSTSERLGAMGTPHYAAPEQLERTGVDDRTDVYALALIFVEMATGRYAYADAPGVLPPREVVQANQLLATPNSLRTLLPNCPESLAALMDAALHKDKNKRPRSKEFLAGLRAAFHALREGSQASTPALEDDDSVDEQLAAPPQQHVVSEPINESSLVRCLPQLRTDVLPSDFEPIDPSAIGKPLPPSRDTIKMPPAPPANAGIDASGRSRSDASSATQNTWAAPTAAPEITTGGRSATLPPERLPLPVDPAPHMEPTSASPAAIESPSVMPPSAFPASPILDDSPAARASAEFASRPTSPWSRQPHPADGVASLTPAPTHHGVQSRATPVTRAPVPLWAGPAAGVALALGVFAIVVAVRGPRHQREPSIAIPVAASPGGTTVAPLADVSPPVSPADTGTAPTIAASTQRVPAAEAPPRDVPVAPALSAKEPQRAAPTATSPKPSASPAQGGSQRQAAARPSGTTGIPANTVAPAAPTLPPPPPASSSSPNPHRLFGTEQ